MKEIVMVARAVIGKSLLLEEERKQAVVDWKVEEFDSGEDTFVNMIDEDIAYSEVEDDNDNTLDVQISVNITSCTVTKETYGETIARKETKVLTHDEFMDMFKHSTFEEMINLELN